jgi:hypothetical protein
MSVNVFYPFSNNNLYTQNLKQFSVFLLSNYLLMSYSFLEFDKNLVNKDLISNYLHIFVMNTDLLTDMELSNQLSIHYGGLKSRYLCLFSDIFYKSENLSLSYSNLYF